MSRGSFSNVAPPPAGESAIEEFAAAMHAALLGALEELGAQIQADWREMIGDSYPPASAPGTPPHRRTGSLQAGITYVVNEAEGGCVLEMSVSRAGGDPGVPMFLEYGTERMAARPHASVQRARWEELAPAIVTELVRARLSLS